jgi:hypothetical protein
MTRRLQQWHKFPYSDSIARYLIKELRELEQASAWRRGVKLASGCTPKMFGKYKN